MLGAQGGDRSGVEAEEPAVGGRQAEVPGRQHAQHVPVRYEGDVTLGEVRPDARDDGVRAGTDLIDGLDSSLLTLGQLNALHDLEWKTFSHKWQVREALAERNSSWALRPEERENHAHNKAVRYRLRHVYDTFRVPLDR